MNFGRARVRPAMMAIQFTKLIYNDKYVDFGVVIPSFPGFINLLN